MRNFKDESFISQYLSPTVMRDMKLFAILDDENEKELLVSAIHDENGYLKIRQLLSDSYNLSFNEPDIQVYSVDIKGDRSLTLHHVQTDRRPLHDDVFEVLKHLYRLWGFSVKLNTYDVNGKEIQTYTFPNNESK